MPLELFGILMLPMLSMLANFHLCLVPRLILLFQWGTYEIAIIASCWRHLRHFRSFDLAAHVWTILTYTLDKLTVMLLLLGMQHSVALKQTFINHCEFFLGDYCRIWAWKWCFNPVWIKKTCRFFNAILGFVLLIDSGITWCLYCRIASFQV